jgi:hypothetical protein
MNRSKIIRPLEQVRQPFSYIVGIEGGDLHAGHITPASA